MRRLPSAVDATSRTGVRCANSGRASSASAGSRRPLADSGRETADRAARSMTMIAAAAVINPAPATYSTNVMNNIPCSFQKVSAISSQLAREQFRDFRRPLVVEFDDIAPAHEREQLLDILIP